jgi:2,5-diketo-D-gluconate reductase A
MSDVPVITLRDGVEIPQVGFGVYQIPPEETAAAVTTALETGYRHIDTAAAYKNEAGVGEAIRASGLGRDEVFVTTKCPNPMHGYDNAVAACEGSLRELGLDHVDLYLIHWPIPYQEDFVDTFRAFLDLRERGLVRSAGVSNFQPEHIEQLIAELGETPSVNQVECHPRLQNRDVREANERLGVATEAWSPLATGIVLDAPEVVAVAEAHGVTPGQAVLRWHLQLGNIIIPKSVTPERIRSNLDLFGFELSDEEIASIESLEAGERTGPNPYTFPRSRT